MIRRILNYTNEQDKQILSQKSEKVEKITPEIETIIQDMKDTLHSVWDAKGISAIQLGYKKQICICSWGGDEVVMINPVIIRTRGEQKYLEGCLSVPNIYKKITRYQKVWCEYFDENWELKTIAEGGRMSDIIQHELDHLNGECLLVDEIGGF